MAKIWASEVRHCSSTSDAAALGDGEVALAGQRVAGPDAGGEDDDLGVDGRRLVALLGAGRPEPQPGHGVVTGDGLGQHAGMHADSELLDVAHERRAAGAVELHRHQSRRHLHDVGLEPELDERVGRLQAEQPAADHDAAGRALAGRADRLEVLDGAVDEAAVLLTPLDGRHERCRAGRQHDGVVVDGVDGAGVGQRLRRGPRCGRDIGDDATDPVDRGDGGVEDEAHPRVGVLPLRQQRQLVRAVGGEEARQRDPVVGGPRLLTQHHDVVGLREPALDGRLDETVADHAVADNNESGAQVRHAVTVGNRCVVRCFLMFRGGKPSLTSLTDHGSNSAESPNSCHR